LSRKTRGGTYLFGYETQAFVHQILGLDFVHTWMIWFGHFMPKPTKLLGSLVGLGSMARKYSKKIWEHRRKRLLRKIRRYNLSFRRLTAVKWYLKRSQKKESVKVHRKTNGLGSWTSGGKDLKSSAAYTRRFADELLSTWESNQFNLAEPAFNLDELLQGCPFPMQHKQYQVQKSAGPKSAGSAGAQPQEEVQVDPTSRPSRCTCWYTDGPSCNACKRLPVPECAVCVVPSVPSTMCTIAVPESAAVHECSVVPRIGALWAEEFDSAKFMDN
jgi:hypothetical protein